MDDEAFKEQLIRKAYSFALKVITFVESLPRGDWTCQIIGKQLLRSATSIGANIVEAQAASSTRDFSNFLTHSLKSANETKFWLGLLRDAGKASLGIVSELLRECDELARILGSSVTTLKAQARSQGAARQRSEL